MFLDVLQDRGQYFVDWLGMVFQIGERHENAVDAVRQYGFPLERIMSHGQDSFESRLEEGNILAGEEQSILLEEIARISNAFGSAEVKPEKVAGFLTAVRMSIAAVEEQNLSGMCDGFLLAAFGVESTALYEHQER